MTTMASFTFGSGNARKLLRLPLYALGALATLAIPRSRRRWAVRIGHRARRRVLWRSIARRALDWTTTSGCGGWRPATRSSRPRGRSASTRSRSTRPRGFWTTARSRVLVVTHGFGDVNRYATRGAFVVQLWHGIPLKKLHLDSPAALRVSFLPNHRLVRGVIARAYRWAGKGIDLFPVASELVAPRIASAFGVPATGSWSRATRATTCCSRATRASGARRRGSCWRPRRRLPADSRCLYAPTWRDGAADPGMPDSGGVGHDRGVAGARGRDRARARASARPRRLRGRARRARPASGCSPRRPGRRRQPGARRRRRSRHRLLVDRLRLLAGRRSDRVPRARHRARTRGGAGCTRTTATSAATAT